jgi:hypothetical protein
MFTSKLIKENGKLVYLDDKSKLNYKLFLDKLPEGQEIEMFIGLSTSDKSVAQLAKVHACIRELAKESGYTFDEMKTLVKEQSGLCYSTGEEIVCKSFADCSKDEIMLTIQACIEIGTMYNINFL